ncbi:MAG: LEA type 2 family protein [Syntrophobacterales bacterium]|nr:LEA type 2 family protein [Syntrophobacterales bacterium]
MGEKRKFEKVTARAGLLFLIALSVAFASCLNRVVEKPTFVLREVTLSPRSLMEMNLLIGLDVRNPNRFDLTLKSFEYKVYLDNEEIGSGRLESEVLVPASSTTAVQAPVAANFKNLGGSLKALITGSDLPYKIEGKAEIKALFGSLTFPFSEEGRLNPKQHEGERK